MTLTKLHIMLNSIKEQLGASTVIFLIGDYYAGGKVRAQITLGSLIDSIKTPNDKIVTWWNGCYTVKDLFKTLSKWNGTPLQFDILFADSYEEWKTNNPSTLPEISKYVRVINPVCTFTNINI